MATLSLGILILQIFLAMGLKYLWNIMNLLQFLIFMEIWQISLPPTTRVILSNLKSLALLEFIPTETFKNGLKSLLGISLSDDPKVEDSCSVEDPSGVNRVASNDLINNMGAMLLIAAIIFAVLVLLVLLRVAQKRCACAKKAFDAIKKKLFWNTFLRYVL